MCVEMRIFGGFQVMNIKLIQLIVGYRNHFAMILSK